MTEFGWPAFMAEARARPTAEWEDGWTWWFAVHAPNGNVLVGEYSPKDYADIRVYDDAADEWTRDDSAWWEAVRKARKLTYVRRAIRDIRRAWIDMLTEEHERGVHDGPRWGYPEPAVPCPLCEKEEWWQEDDDAETGA